MWTLVSYQNDKLLVTESNGPHGEATASNHFAKTYSNILLLIPGRHSKEIYFLNKKDLTCKKLVDLYKL